MPKTRKQTARKRKAPTTTVTEHSGRDETINLLKQGSNQGMTQIVDFQTIIEKSLELPKGTRQKTSPIQIGDIPSDVPAMIRCGGDKLGLHISEHIKANISQNLAVLLKGSVEPTETSNGILGIDEDGNIVTKPKATAEKIQHIEKWTDAF